MVVLFRIVGRQSRSYLDTQVQFLVGSLLVEVFSLNVLENMSSLLTFFCFYWQMCTSCLQLQDLILVRVEKII